MVKEGADSKQPTLDDFTVNGKYCKSGLAYPISDDEGRCTTFSHMTFDGVKLTNSSNPCDPSDQEKKCRLFYQVRDDDKSSEAYRKEGSRLYVENDCKCALDGRVNGGYCQSMLGTELYQRAVEAHAYMLSQSKCHTRDRYNMRAQRDTKCGIGKDSDEFRFAIDQMFNMTYWPYIQTEETFKCVRRFFADSFDSLILDHAVRM